ncbi:MAG: hypothetical protein QXJ62_06015 [Nitrososphaeria archaeon]
MDDDKGGPEYSLFSSYEELRSKIFGGDLTVANARILQKNLSLLREDYQVMAALDFLNQVIKVEQDEVRVNEMYLPIEKDSHLTTAR